MMALFVLVWAHFRAKSALLGCTALLIATAGCGTKGTPPATVETVQAGTVDEIAPEVEERYSASIIPNKQVDLAFKSPGIVAQVYQVRGADGRLRDVEAGDQVAEGTQLASVRPLDYQQRVGQGEAGVSQAEAQLSQAKAAFANAELDYTRARNLYNSASLIKPDFDRARAQYESTQAQVQAAQSAVENARIQVSEAKLSLEDTAVRAPFAGYVTARNVSKGSLAGNSTAGFSMIDTHVVKAEFAVSDTSLQRVHLGQRLTVTLDALPRPVTGVVTSISPQADPKSRVFSVDLTIANPSGAARPGMIGSVSLGAAAHPAKRLVVPLSAVVRAPETHGFGVFRIESREGKKYAVTQPVQIGNTYGNAIEVTSGVSKGQPIVALGGELLRNGQEIHVLQ